MDDEGALFDSGFDDTGPFRVSPESGGVSLESALRDFGPAAIDDLIPRLRVIARRLDAAHRDGVVHGALHPSKIIISDDRTTVVAGKNPHAPYAAPEVIDGYGAAPASDQYALAAIAYEWLFGRPVSTHGSRPIDVRSMPGVDRAQLTAAFTRALSPDPDHRFPTCVALCDALASAVVPELPLISDVEDFPAEETPIAAAPVAITIEDSLIAAEPPDLEDIEIVAAEPVLTRAPDLDTLDAGASIPESAAVPSWNPTTTSFSERPMETPRFGAMALFLAVIVGAVFGFAAGYMARPRALQSGPPQTIASAPTGTEGATQKTPDETKADVPKADAPKSDALKTEAPKAPKAPLAPQAPIASGSLLVRSTPPGASVSVDGVTRGVTPVALRGFDVGTHTVTIARRGFIAETRKVTMTKARPARTLDVRLATAAVAAPSAPRPSTPATIGKPAVTTGTLSIDSRPPGAAVMINGKASGNTPLTLNDLAPGEYRILITLPGYREFATTVRVVAGERARAAASLTALEF